MTTDANIAPNIPAAAEPAPTLPAASGGAPTTALGIAEQLAAGTIDHRQAGKLAKVSNLSTLDVANGLRAVRAAADQAHDTRSPAVKEADAIYGTPADERAYRLQFYTPGQEPSETPKDVAEFDARARGWMHEMGLSKPFGDSLFQTVAKQIQRTSTLSPEARESVKEKENDKLRALYGGQEKLEEALQPARRMVEELEQVRPGIKAFIQQHGDHALFVAQLIRAARGYHARKR